MLRDKGFGLDSFDGAYALPSPRANRSGAQTAKHVTDLVDYLCSQAHHQEIFYLWRPCLTDPGDDMVLELAVAAQAPTVVTHNLKDFAAGAQFGVTPIAPGVFLQNLMKG